MTERPEIIDLAARRPKEAKSRFSEGAKSRKPRETPLPQMQTIHTQRFAVDRDGVPLGHQGPVTQSWLQPPCFGMWLLIAVEPRSANSSNR